MNEDSSAWDSRRWRDAAASFTSPAPPPRLQHSSAHPSSHAHYFSRPGGPPLSAASASHPSSQKASLPDQKTTTPNDAWPGGSRETDPRSQRDLPRLTEPYGYDATTTDASTFQPRQDQRHHHSPSSGPQQLPGTSLRETSAPWQQRSLHHHHHRHDDRRLSLSDPADAPQLTLHIPPAQGMYKSSLCPFSRQSHVFSMPFLQPFRANHGGVVVTDLPRISTSHITPQHNHQHHTHHNFQPSTPSTSLPPFAAFKAQSGRADDADGPEIAPMSERLSCSQCLKLIPLVKEVTAVVAELDENVQSHCNKSVTRTHDAPNDDSFRAVEWILDRLRYAKNDLQEAARRNYGDLSQHQQGAVFRNVTPPNPLKRPGEPWERDELHAPKRPRSRTANDHPYQLPAFTPRSDHRPSIDFTASESRLGYSPPPTDSVPGSAHPRTASPTFTHRLHTRALPSPSSMAYPSSAAASLAPQAPSVGSPATSYQPASSIHTTSTNSATSAHIADLQHQVTLKSLALQTLQSEYASLLQKLQRERVKSQTIEKKTTVADQEVNDLTGKNEDLLEQVKMLETALDESEQKREAKNAEAAREKEQWGRMLYMSGQLQMKADSEKAKLLEEKASLERRLIAQAGGLEETSADQAERDRNQNTSTPALTGVASPGTASAIEHSLRGEISHLKERIQALRSALEKVQQHNQELAKSSRELLERSNEYSETVGKALQEDQPPADYPSERELTACHPERDAPPSFRAPPPSSFSVASPVPPAQQQAASQPLTITRLSKSPPQSGTFEVINNGKRTVARIADVARAVSPGPEELGFHVAPTTSTPEELIKALGPVPAPLPSFHFQPQSSAWTPLSAPPLRMNRTGNRRVEAAPHSYHSSPREGSMSSGSGDRSPEAYASDPELSGESGRKGLHSHPAAPPFHQHTYSGREQPRQFDESINKWRQSMPPPPRPESATFLPRTHM